MIAPDGCDQDKSYLCGSRRHCKDEYQRPQKGLPHQAARRHTNHNVTVYTTPPRIRLSRDCALSLRNLEIVALFEHSENALRNLQIAQIPKLRGTYLYHRAYTQDSFKTAVGRNIYTYMYMYSDAGHSWETEGSVFSLDGMSVGLAWRALLQSQWGTW